MPEPTTKPFIRPGKLFLLTLLGVLVYMVALVTLVPAGWLWQQASSYVVLPPEIQVQQVSGKLWEGQAGVLLAGYPVRVDWSLGQPLWLTGEMPLDFKVATAGSSLSGSAVLGVSGSGQAQARGAIDVSEFERLIQQSGGAMIEGNVSIDRLNVEWENQKLTKAEGLGRWGGGLVTWPMGNSRGRADFPPMRATLNSSNDGIQLVVAEQAGDGPAADANIRWTGMMELRVYKRMVDLAGQNWSDSASPGDVIFRVRQPLIPGSALR